MTTIDASERSRPGFPLGVFENRVRTSDSTSVTVTPYARFERNALILVVRGSFISRLYSGESTAIRAILPSALL